MTGMWIEKYRPTKLSEIVNQTEIIGNIETLISNSADMSHLLFSGSAGVGKTTTPTVFQTRSNECTNVYTLELNVSNRDGLNYTLLML